MIPSWKENLKGESCPWRIGTILDDGSINPTDHVLKYFCEGQDIPRLIEYVGGRIAQEMDIGSPAVSLIELPRDLLQVMVETQTPANFLDLAIPGRHVAYEYVDGAGPLWREPVCLGNLERHQQKGEIVGFDTLLHNRERHGENVLVVPASAHGRPAHRLVPIDFGACFMGSINPERLRQIDDFMGILAMHPINAYLRSSRDFDGAIDKIRVLGGSESRLRSIIEWVPEEWNVPRDWLGELTRHILRRVNVTINVLRTGTPPGARDWQHSLHWT